MSHMFPHLTQTPGIAHDCFALKGSYSVFESSDGTSYLAAVCIAICQQRDTLLFRGVSTLVEDEVGSNSILT